MFTTNILNAKSRKTGFSLFEIAMVLAIIALLIAGVMLFYSNASRQNQFTDVQKELTVVRSVVDSIYSGTADMPAALGWQTPTGLIAKSGQVPAKWVNNGYLVSPFGPLQVYFSSSQADSSWNYAFFNISRTICIQLAMSQNENSANAISINQNAGLAYGGATCR